jgi:hypothetical protein
MKAMFGSRNGLGSIGDSGAGEACFAPTKPNQNVLQVHT